MQRKNSRGIKYYPNHSLLTIPSKQVCKDCFYYYITPAMLTARYLENVDSNKVGTKSKNDKIQ